RRNLSAPTTLGGRTVPVRAGRNVAWDPFLRSDGAAHGDAHPRHEPGRPADRHVSAPHAPACADGPCTGTRHGPATGPALGLARTGRAGVGAARSSAACRDAAFA